MPMRKSTVLCLVGLVCAAVGFGLAYYSAESTYTPPGGVITVIQHPYFTLGAVIMAIGLLIIIFGFGLRELLRNSF